MMNNGMYFVVIAFFVAELFKVKLDNLRRHDVDTKWSKITKYGISV